MLHDLHLEYIRSSHINTVPGLVRLLDGLDPKLRDSAMGLAYMQVIQPKSREPQSAFETMNDRIEGPINYNRFKLALMKLSREVNEDLLVLGVVSSILGTLYGAASADKQKAIQYLKGVIERSEGVLASETHELKIAGAQRALETCRAKIDNYDHDAAEHKTAYEVFCNHVLRGLLDEQEELESAMVDRLRERSRTLPEEEFPGAPKEPGFDNV